MQLLQVPRSLLCFGNPFSHLGFGPDLEANLEGLGVCGQRSGIGVALDGIHNGEISLVLGRKDFKGGDDADVGGVEFTVGQV